MTKGKIDRHMLLQNCLRGGSWYDSPGYCRSAYFCRSAFRGWDFPDIRYSTFGFRVVRVPKPSVNKEQESVDGKKKD